MKKRQEIGRGLRLPVDQDGMRVFDESVNKLYVMANEATRTSPAPCKPSTRRIAASPSARCRSRHLPHYPRRRWRGRADRQGGGRGDPEGACRAEDARDRWPSQPAFDPRKTDFKLELPPALCGLGAGRHGPAGVLPDRAPYPQGDGRGAEPAQKGSDAQPRVSRRCGTGSSRRRPTASSSRPTTWPPRRGRHQEDGEDRGRRRSGSTAGRVEVRKGGVAAEAMSAAEEQVDDCAPRRARRAGLPAKRDRTDPLDAGADSQGIRPAGRILRQSATLHGSSRRRS